MLAWMNRRLKQICATAVLAAFCAGAYAAAAGEPKDSVQAQAKLAEVRARIAQLTGRLGEELKQRDILSARLREADMTVTAKRRQLDTLRASQAVAERRRTELRAQQAREEHALRAERSALAAQVRAAYMIGRQEQLKLLLNQSDPASAGRTLAYYGYFAAERSEKIEAIRGQVENLQKVAVQIAQQNAELNALSADARRDVEDVEHARTARAAALMAVTRHLASGNQQLADLRRQEHAVESLVSDLTQVLQDFPIDQTQSFEKLRGRMSWPVMGRLTARYQQPHANGVMIEAARGSKVRAPFFGRVVYADWLQGLGLLLIIAHSDGYMTLYGHAEVIYKSVGDWVAPGDAIAALGDSANAAPQLYFEMRSGRKTVDPKEWLKPNP
jgi:murein hydrolase activator